jgi:hypothetical protein
MSNGKALLAMTRNLEVMLISLYRETGKKDWFRMHLKVCSKIRILLVFIIKKIKGNRVFSKNR